MILKMLFCLGLALTPLCATDLSVTISGISTERGEIGCALFADAAGFPLDTAKATTIWIRPKSGVAECKFSKLRAGWYALAVSHDLNSNRRTDTNLLGMPKEDWGVSNNVRPRLRAPRFEEARFEIKAGEAARLEVRIAR